MKKKAIVAVISIFLMTIPALQASQQEEIRFLLKYGQKVLIEGSRRGEAKWDKACRLMRKSNYVAIVQNDGSSYRIVPVPLGKQVEKMCPPDIFQDALRWYHKLNR